MGMMLIFGLAVIILLGFGIWLMKRLGLAHIETPEKRAGRLGEEIATGIVQEVLRDDDALLVNIPLFIDNMQTELDNLVVNRHGLHIIEVKNLNGMLIGEEDDDYWVQTQSAGGGSYFRQKTIKNPIRQVRRQADILSRVLGKYGVNTQIYGYVFFVEMNSPIKSECILETQGDIDAAIHQEEGQDISPETRDNLVSILVNGRKKKGLSAAP